jgi:hypothetical protein
MSLPKAHFQPVRYFRDVTSLTIMASDRTPTRQYSERRHLRKGTFSCWECKRRKVRCTLAMNGTSSCEACNRRGTSCVGQNLPETGIPIELVRHRSGKKRSDRRISASDNLNEVANSPQVQEGNSSGSMENYGVLRHTDNSFVIPLNIVPTNSEHPPSFGDYIQDQEVCQLPNLCIFTHLTGSFRMPNTEEQTH